MKRRKKVEIRDVRIAGQNHAVTTFAVGGDGHCKEVMSRPCAQCPWRSDIPAGEFPAEAFRLSAGTSYDGAMAAFGCHMSGVEGAKTCAGFVLQNSDNNIGMRIALMRGTDISGVSSPYPLYDSYKEMAVANGVDPDDAVLAKCRANDE